MSTTANSWAQMLPMFLEELRQHPRSARQADAIVRAAENGGYVSCAEVAEMLGVADEVKLVNFAAPVTNRCAVFREQGLVEPWAPDLLTTIYYGDSTDWTTQRLVAYRVPWEAVELLKRAP